METVLKMQIKIQKLRKKHQRNMKMIMKVLGAQMKNLQKNKTG